MDRIEGVTRADDALTGLEENHSRRGMIKGFKSAQNRQHNTMTNDSSKESLTCLLPGVLELSLDRDNKPSPGVDLSRVPPAATNELETSPSRMIAMDLNNVVDLDKEMEDRIKDINTLSNTCIRGKGSSVGCLWKYDRSATPPPGARVVDQAISHIDQSQHISIRQLLGSGSFGSVHAASVNGISRAVKSIRASMAELEKAVGEAEIGYHMVHPNIVRTFSYQISDDAFYNALVARNSEVQATPSNLSMLDSDEYIFVRIIQELCDIGPLTKYITGKISIQCDFTALSTKESCVLIALDIVNALMYLKRHGVIHGDLSGNNVLLSTNSMSPLGMRAKVCDFGRSRLTREKMMTNTLGTVSYMPPEMVLSGELNSKTDIYSLGILMIEMLTKELVWDGQQPVQILFAMSSGLRVEVPQQGIPSDMRDFLVSCLRDVPGDRPTPEMAFTELQKMIPFELIQAHFGADWDLQVLQ